MSDNDKILEQYFGYLPSTPLAVIATISYFLVSLPLFYESYRHGNRLTYVLPITALVECVGYIVRLYMIGHASLNAYVQMGMLIILAPNALAFANYKVLGKILHVKTVHMATYPTEKHEKNKLAFHIPYVMNEYGEVHGNRLASFFFLSDVVAIVLQGAGGGMQGAGNATLGTDVLLFGLASQLFFFAIFTALAVYAFKSPIYQQAQIIDISEPNTVVDKNTVSGQDYHRAFIGLFATIAVLFARNIYRVIEFTMGYRGYLATTEIFMYLFDTLLIFFSLILYLRYNFAEFLSKADKQLQNDLSVSASPNEQEKSLHGEVEVAKNGNETLVRMVEKLAKEQNSQRGIAGRMNGDMV